MKSQNKLKKSRIILSFDPGSVNAGVCVLKTYAIGKAKVLHSGMLRCPIYDITKEQFQDSLVKFRREIKKLFRIYKPNIVVAERFMVRGRMGGASAEKVSIMLGCIFTTALINCAECKLISSALWKSAFNRHFSRGLDELYKSVKPLPPHLIDANLIANFGANWNEKKPFAYWKFEQIHQIRKLFKPIKRTSR